LRCSIIRWKEDLTPPGGAALPTLGEIMHDVNRPQGPFRFASKGKFDVLWTMPIIVSNTLANTNNQKLYSFYRKVGKKQRSFFDGANSKKYHYFFVASSDVAAAGSPPMVSFDITVRYTDS